MSFHHDGLIGPHYNAPGSDYMVYYDAARSYLAGDPDLLSDGANFTARLNHDFANWLTGPLPPHPWVYPPPFLLLLLPFAFLPFAASYAAFVAATFAAAVAGVWCAVRQAGERSVWVAALLLAPATAIDVIDGQNGLLTAGILLGGFGLLQRSPVAAGMVLGAIAYKPQLALMVPVALLGLRAWRALAAAGLTAAAWAAASVAILGSGIWRGWLHWMLGGGAGYAEWVEWGRLWGLSLYTCAVLHGASPAVAELLQAAGAVAAAGAVYHAYRHPFGFAQRLAILLAATVLAAPHLSPYDLILLACAAVLLWRCETQVASSAILRMLLFFLWVAPVFGRFGRLNTSDMVPLLAASTVVAVLGLGHADRRVRATAA